MGDEHPDAVLAAAGRDLADAIDTALPEWVEQCVARLVIAWHGSVSADVAEAARGAGAAAVADVGPRIRALVTADVDDQRTNPLAVLRSAVRHPAGVLREAGVPAVERDRWDEERFPDDVYGLTPMTWADLHDTLMEPGLRWGAAKAMAHRARHT